MRQRTVTELRLMLQSNKLQSQADPIHKMKIIETELIVHNNHWDMEWIYVLDLIRNIKPEPDYIPMFDLIWV